MDINKRDVPNKHDGRKLWKVKCTNLMKNLRKLHT